MQQMQPPDIARVVADQIRDVLSCFEKADEVYRRFRVSLLEDPPPPEFSVPEWIPISKH
jgi:hypothetical protein